MNTRLIGKVAGLVQREAQVANTVAKVIVQKI